MCILCRLVIIFTAGNLYISVKKYLENPLFPDSPSPCDAFPYQMDSLPISKKLFRNAVRDKQEINGLKMGQDLQCWSYTAPITS